MMNRNQLFEFHKEFTDKAFDILVKKNHDYSGKNGENPFANFQRCEAMGICDTRVGMAVRIIDKISRLSTYIESGKLMVDNEGYEDALLDIVNYCILFAAYSKGMESNEK